MKKLNESIEKLFLTYIFLVLLAAVLTGCAIPNSWKDEVYGRNQPIQSSIYARQTTTPQEVDQYLTKHVGQKTLKKWDRHVSDDKTVIEMYDRNGAYIGKAIGK